MHYKNVHLIEKILSNLSLSDSEKLSRIRSVCDDMGKIEIPENEKYARKLSDWVSLGESNTAITDKGISTGFTSVDKIIGGLFDEELVVIGARPEMGMTQLSIQMALSISLNYPVLYYSFDESRASFYKRIFRTFNEFCSFDNLPDKEKNLNTQQLIELSNNRQLYICDCFYYKQLSNLKGHIEREISEHKIKVVLINSIQLMCLEKSNFRNRDLELSIIISDLKQLAKEYKISIILLSQLNRGPENRQGFEGKRPQLADLRDSGSLENYANKVILLNRPVFNGVREDMLGNDLTNIAELIVDKNDTGETGTVKLFYSNGIFKDFENKSISEFDFDSERLTEIDDYPPF